MRSKFFLIFLAVLTGLAACSPVPSRENPPTVPTGSPQANLPNPASVFCEQAGFTSEIRAGADGSQSGYCIFPDGSECDEWLYYRGECGSTPPTSQPDEEVPQGWATYWNETPAYSFQYPVNATIGLDDNPLNSLSISGTGMDGEFWSISHPADREEFRPPQGVTLEQWLNDHYLVGEKRMPDTQIDGNLAIHYRHDRSPQSYADDRYYVAHDGQLYVVLIGHTGETENWELNEHFLESIHFEP